MQLKPLEDRVLLKPLALREERTLGGLYLPESSQDGPVEAEVVAIGQDESIPVKAGDHVLVTKFAGTEVRVNGVQMLLVSKNDLLAIVEPDETPATAGSPAGKQE